jgi:hypothetical protein
MQGRAQLSEHTHLEHKHLEIYPDVVMGIHNI